MFLLIVLFAWKAFLTHEATYMQIGMLCALVTIFGLFFSFWALVMSFLVRIYKQNMWGRAFSRTTHDEP